MKELESLHFASNRIYGYGDNNTSYLMEVRQVIKELTEREAELEAQIVELKGQNERLERKKDDYPNVLAKVMNDLEFLRATATEREAKLVENLEDMCSAYKALCQLQKVDYYLSESSKYAKAQKALLELNKE